MIGRMVWAGCTIVVVVMAFCSYGSDRRRDRDHATDGESKEDGDSAGQHDQETDAESSELVRPRAGWRTADANENHKQLMMNPLAEFSASLEHHG